MTYSPEMKAARDATLAAIAADDAAGRLGSSRGRGWRHDEPQTEADAERWLDAHPDRVSEDLEALGEHQDAVALRSHEHDPDDVVDHPGGARWTALMLGEAWT